MGLTAVSVERMRILVCRKHNWKCKQIQTKVINAEQALWQGANRFPFDRQCNWWLSRSFFNRKKLCQNLLLEKSPTQSDYQNTAGCPREEDLWTTGKNNTWKYSISFDLRRTNSITRKLCLATAIDWHYWHFLTLAFLTAFLPFLLSLSKHLSSSYLCFWQLSNSLCWLSECPSLWICLWLLVLVIYLFEIVIYWIAIESNYF